MFTGIIEEVGTIVAVREAGNGRELMVGCRAVCEGTSLGDSIAVDGVCLTVTDLPGGGFIAEAVATTLARTTLGRLQPGLRVNLERALSLGQRLGGHMVQGHVDGVGEVRAVRDEGEHTLIDLAIPEDVAAVTVLHGSIAVNGVSMTVNALPAPGVCQLSVVPYTREHTTLAQLAPGDPVNLEGDMIGKYVRHLLGAPGQGGGDLTRAWGYQ